MATSLRRRSAFRLAHEPEGLVKSSKKSKPAVRPFKKSPDRHSFMHLAKILTEGERNEMLNAVDRLQGKARVLVELACFSSFSFVRLAAASHLSKDPEALIEIAKYCQFDDTRAAALDDLSKNKKALVEVACSSLFKDTRLDAVSLLTDPSSLADIATSSPNRDSRVAALEKISDDSPALRKVAQDSRYSSARKEAVKHISSDVEALCALISDASFPDVKKLAASMLSEVVEDLDDVDALIEVAKIAPSEDARYLAIGRLSEEPWALRTIVKEARHRDARTTALMLLSDVVSELDDPEMLAEVAIMSPYEDCRSSAVERLVGQSSALLSIATRSKFKDARDLAVDKLEGDTESLKTVSKLAKYRDTRVKAHKRVSDPEVFQGELKRILG